ncbi:MAG: amidinotransferase [Chloroflexi bacterium]|nr:amidinotransferase [Chloroflexota bacterium]|tara:strand:- start:2381 stop:3280 length:900 start_codon:yes stop_codon:yes gene_type:complete
MNREIMGNIKYGLNSNVSTLKTVLLKDPKAAFKSQKTIDLQWQNLNFIEKPDYKKSIIQYGKFVDILNDNHVEVLFIPEDEKTSLDSIYTHDPMFMTPNGAVIGNMGKKQRKPETIMMKSYLDEMGIPIFGEIDNGGTLEGGDAIWINDKTVAVGLTYRTNNEGINQLRKILSTISVELICVDLPHWNGPVDVLHLMSLISPLKEDLFLIYEKLLPVGFLEFLNKIAIKTISIADEDYDTLGCNVLPLSTTKCLITNGNDRTTKIIEDNGIEVIEFQASEICYKGSGGPTCLTRPLYRD